MSANRYQYYSCDDESLIADILRAAINTEQDDFELHVYSRNTVGAIRCQSTANTKAGYNDSLPRAGLGLGAAVLATIACGLFLPIAELAGIVTYVSLVFISGMIGAWAGGSFSQNNLPSRLRKALKNLKAGRLIITCRARPAGQENVRQALGRYSRILPLNAKLVVNEPKKAEPGQNLAS